MNVISKYDFTYIDGDCDVDPIFVFKRDENIAIQVCDYAEEIGEKYNVGQKTDDGFIFYPQKTLAEAMKKVAHLHLGIEQ
jgi:hypothetical protein